MFSRPIRQERSPPAKDPLPPRGQTPIRWVRISVRWLIPTVSSFAVFFLLRSFFPFILMLVFSWLDFAWIARAIDRLFYGLVHSLVPAPPLVMSNPTLPMRCIGVYSRLRLVQCVRQTRVDKSINMLSTGLLSETRIPNSTSYRATNRLLSGLNGTVKDRQSSEQHVPSVCLSGYLGLALVYYVRVAWLA